MATARYWRRHLGAAFMVVLGGATPAHAAWNAVLSDDFDGPAGAMPDASKWAQNDVSSTLGLEPEFAEQVRLDGAGSVYIESAQISSFTTLTLDSGGAALEFRATASANSHGALADYRCALAPACSDGSPQVDVLGQWRRFSARHAPTALITSDPGYLTYRVEWLDSRVELYVLESSGEQYHVTQRHNLPSGTLKAMFDAGNKGSALSVDYVRLYTLGGLVASNKTYRIRSKVSGRCLDLPAAGGSASSTADFLAQAPLLTEAAPTQRFTLYDAGDDGYRIASVASPAHRLEAAGPANAGAALHGAREARTDAQLWKVINVGAGYYQIKPVTDESACLDAGAVNQESVALATCHEGDSQKFRFDEF